MNTILIVMAVYLVPMMLAGVLYSVEWIALKVQELHQRRTIERRLDRLTADYFTGEQE